MDAFNAYLNDLWNANKIQFSDFPNIKWLNPYQAAKSQEKYNNFIAEFEDNWLYKGTKPFHRQISKGCMLCGLGVWSCLFITGKCNAGCFYCPSSQLADEVPGTQSFSFESPDSYTDYINFFKFRGISFSGGEPLLFFDRTLQYLKHVRKKCAPEIYIWMYTNGILADDQKFKKLAAAGLNEVRLDIGATKYNLAKINLAKGIIPKITIEIPAIPEEKETLKKLLPEMIKAGVTNLNLHQLRLTKYNAPKLLKHNYTYIPAEQPIVLESELAALEILQYAHKHHLNIGINYCSFYFKNRFQKAGFRKQVAKAVAGENDMINEKGFIREFDENSIGYKAILLSDKNPFQNDCRELNLPNKTFYVRRETAMKKTDLTKQKKPKVEKLIQSESNEIPSDPTLFKIWQLEHIERGLREY